MIKFVKGDMFVTPGVTVIAHGVNLDGAFAAGVAGEIARRYPWARADYWEWVKFGPFNDLGNLKVSHPPQDRRPAPSIVHLATQKHPGADARIYAIQKSLKFLGTVLPVHGSVTLALPQIGCGIGGLEWVDVRKVMVEVFENTPKTQVLVFEEYERGIPAKEIP